MCQLFESIKCIDGVLQDLKYHQDRVDHAVAVHFPEKKSTDLNKIKLDGQQLSGLFKCKFIYDRNSEAFFVEPYLIKPVNSLRIIDGSHLRYDHKYINRRLIDILFKKRQDQDDIIIVKNGFVTDSSYANLAFFADDCWYTPSDPLLPGTKRQKLIDMGILKMAKIKETDINMFEKVSLINAMLELGAIEIKICNVY